MEISVVHLHLVLTTVKAEKRIGKRRRNYEKERKTALVLKKWHM